MQCKKCKTEVGCSCNLDANLLCDKCSPITIKIALPIKKSYSIKKRKLGYIT